MKTILLALFVGLTISCCNGYRILGIFTFHGKSHFYMFEALMKGLARKGHQVDVISELPLSKPFPNYTDIVVLPVAISNLNNNITFGYATHMTSDITAWVATNVGNKQCSTLGHPAMKEFIKNPPNDPPYDLVIAEYLVAHCFFALGHHLKVPVVGAISSGFYPFLNRLIGNPGNLAFVPNNFLDYKRPMTFWQRLHNTMGVVYNDIVFRYITAAQDDIIKEHFGENAPGVRELEKNLSLVLVNTHFSVNGPKPMTSAVVEVGGLHIQDEGPELPKDLKEWMDQSTEGFVYFTFGSMIRIETLPERIVHGIYKSLGKIAPVRVLMKVQDPKLLPSDFPLNIRTFEWASQMRILKHKNIRAFITHGGLMSSQEAIHYAVPMIGMPVFADQSTNVASWVQKKIAVALRLEDVTENKMDEALSEILCNPVYRNTARKVAEEFHDRPMKPMETAIWWIEYVIRNRGGNLRSPALDLSWWQIELLDVYAFILLLLAAVIFISIRSLQFLCNGFCTTKKSVRAVKSNKAE